MIRVPKLNKGAEARLGQYEADARAAVDLITTHHYWSSQERDAALAGLYEAALRNLFNNRGLAPEERLRNYAEARVYGNALGRNPDELIATARLVVDAATAARRAIRP